MSAKPMTENQRKVLKEINDSVPRQWLNSLTRKQWAYPTLRELVDRGLEQNDLAKGLREKLETLKKSQEYSAQEDVIDEEIEKKIDEHLTRKVRQAIKNGSLPPLDKEQINAIRKES